MQLANKFLVGASVATLVAIVATGPDNPYIRQNGLFLCLAVFLLVFGVFMEKVEKECREAEEKDAAAEEKARKATGF